MFGGIRRRGVGRAPVVATLLAAGIGALAVAPAALSANEDGQRLSARDNGPRLDYGDAPDRRATGYGPLGRFPSLHESNGARARNTDEIRLGGVTKELDSQQVNRDARDDGYSARLLSCRSSIAQFRVLLPEGGPRRGTAYLNLWADWNRDGRWRGRDECQREWAIRNQPIDLSQHRGRTVIYSIPFIAGDFPSLRDDRSVPMWQRATVSLNQRMRGPQRVIRDGEVEDHIRARLIRHAAECHVARAAPGGFPGAFGFPATPLTLAPGSVGFLKATPRPLFSGAPVTGQVLGTSLASLPNNARRSIDKLFGLPDTWRYAVSPDAESYDEKVWLRALLGRFGRQEGPVHHLMCPVQVRKGTPPARGPGGEGEGSGAGGPSNPGGSGAPGGSGGPGGTVPPGGAPPPQPAPKSKTAPNVRVVCPPTQGSTTIVRTRINIPADATGVSATVLDEGGKEINPSSICPGSVGSVIVRINPPGSNPAPGEQVVEHELTIQNTSGVASPDRTVQVRAQWQ